MYLNFHNTWGRSAVPKPKIIFATVKWNKIMLICIKLKILLVNGPEKVTYI